MTLRHSLARAQFKLESRFGPSTWRTPPRGGSPRILVIGNCQGVAIGQAMKYLLPQAEVTSIPVHHVRRRFPRMADLVALGQRHDVVFANGFTMPFRDGGTFETLRAATRLFAMPPIVFSAFHPDLVYVGQHDVADNRGIVFGPMGSYHSALILFAYLEGYAVEAALRLFDAEVYEALGYFGMWGASSDLLQSLGRDAGYDLAGPLARWTRRGCFMHSTNHPKMFVAADLARGLLDKAGIGYADCDLDSYLVDTFIDGGTWPVYRPIADYYGVAASELFLKSPSIRTGPARTMTLPIFAARAYQYYGGRDRATLVSDRVERWRADEATRTTLRAAAAR